MKKAFFTVAAGLLFSASVAFAGGAPENMDDVVKVTPVEGGYAFELAHYTCSKNGYPVAFQAQTLLKRLAGKQPTEKEAEQLTELYKNTIGKAMAEPLDTWIGQHTASELASLVNAYRTNEKSSAFESTDEMGRFNLTYAAESHAFMLDAGEIFEPGKTADMSAGGVEFYPNLMPAPGDALSPACLKF